MSYNTCLLQIRCQCHQQRCSSVSIRTSSDRPDVVHPTKPCETPLSSMYISSHLPGSQPTTCDRVLRITRGRQCNLAEAQETAEGSSMPSSRIRHSVLCSVLHIDTSPFKWAYPHSEVPVFIIPLICVIRYLLSHWALQAATEGSRICSPGG
jgi:hypothetical protein